MTAETRAQSSGCLYPRPILSAEHLTPSLDYALEKVSPAPPPRLAPGGPGAGGMGWSSGISLARLPRHPPSDWRTGLRACVVAFSAEKPDGTRWWAGFQGFDARAATLVVCVCAGGGDKYCGKPTQSLTNDDVPLGFIKDSLAPYRCENRDGGVHTPTSRCKTEELHLARGGL